MNRDETLFAAALDLPEADRAAFLERACSGDAALRTRVAALLAAQADAARLFAQPAVPRTASAEELPGERIGAYKLLERLGEGGCGVVWMAEQEQPVRRRVALKIIKLGMDTREVIARFEAERQALALMDHPNIARVFDGGTTALGRPFFVMELVRGVTITRYCDENRLTTAQRLELFLPVCAAVEHAHQKGIIHRDLKPGNILVTVNHGAPVPKVIDFGVAKATQGRLTEHTVFTAFRQFIGTPVYMSPEQADLGSLDIDTRSDIYSLGVLLYELLAGQTPFDAKTLAQAGLEDLRRQLRENEPPRPSTRLRTLPGAGAETVARNRGTAASQLSLELRGDLDWIVMHCLEKDRTRRYETASALAADVQRHLRHEPVLARPPSTPYLLGKLIRRHRVAFAAAATVAVVVVLGAAVSTWQAVRATRAEQEQARLRADEAVQRRRAEAAELAARRRAYAADINLVQQALALDNLGRAQLLLERLRPQPGEPDLRGWEWRYLWQFSRSDALSQLAAKDDTAINALAVSADGTWLAVAEASLGGLSVWNLATREEIRLPAGRAGVRVAFSPRAPLLAVAISVEAEPRARVLLWDAATRRVVHELSPGGNFAYGLAFSADGRRLATGTVGPQGEIAVWEVADGRKLSVTPAQVSAVDVRFSAFAATSDLGRIAYVAANDRRIRVVDPATGREQWSALGAEEFVLALAFSPDGRTLASGAGWSESAIRLWDAATGTELGRLEGNRRFVSQLAFWPDGKTLASSGGDHTLRVWDVPGRRLVRTLRGHRAEVQTLALLPDGRTLVSGAKDGEVKFWDGLADRAQDAAIRLPGGPAAWRFAAAGDALLAVEVDGRTLSQVVERRGRTFAAEKVLIDLRPAGHRFAALARDRPQLVTWGGPDRRALLWDLETGKIRREFKLLPAEGGFGAIDFLPDTGDLAITRVRADQTVFLEHYDTATGELRRSWKLPDRQQEPRLSPDGKYFVLTLEQSRFLPTGAAPAAAGYLRTELATGASALLPARLNQADIGGAGFSPDSRYFAQGSGAGYVDIIDLATWQRVATLSGAMSGMYAPAFSADSQRVAIGGSGNDSMMVWDAVSFERLITLPTPNSRLGLLAFSPDGNLLGARSAAGCILGGSDRGALYVWRAPSWAEIAAYDAKAAGK